MKIALPAIYITRCEHITVTKDAGLHSVEINFDHGTLTIFVVGDPVLEVLETDTQGENEHD